MRFIFLLFLLNIYIFAKITIAATILPESYIIQNIAKKKAEVITLIPKNQSPHTYEPKISTMQQISKAKLYFTIGVEFEKEWIKKIANQNPKLHIIACDKNITKINNNPHIWLNPKNIIKIASCISNTLQHYDKENATYYQKNFNEFVQKIKHYDEKIKKILTNLKTKSFLDIHPAWIYFAKYYHLKEYTIEIEGKQPLIKDLIKLIQFAKKKHIKIIFVQPEFSSQSAKIIANEVNAKVVPISPLQEDILKNLLNFAQELRKSNGN